MGFLGFFGVLGGSWGSWGFLGFLGFLGVLGGSWVLGFFGKCLKINAMNCITHLFYLSPVQSLFFSIRY